MARDEYYTTTKGAMGIIEAVQASSVFTKILLKTFQTQAESSERTFKRTFKVQ
jgi:hypothetical protein